MNTETENGTQMTLEQWLPQACPQQTVGVSGSHARTSALPENRQDSADTVLLCFFAVTGLIRDTEEENRPKYLFIENVENLLSINMGGRFPQTSH